MAVDELIDERVSAAQCKKAVDALLAHETKVQEKKSENDLLGSAEVNLWLVVTTKKMHSEAKLKPARIQLKHPLVDPRTSPVCLITKDPQREYKDLLEKNNIRFINRVVGITKLKGKFKPFEARRLLLKENGLFLADDRVVPLLPKLLGKTFFKAKKQPIPVSLTKKDIKSELERAISSTYFHQNQGTCVSVKIGTLSHTPAQVLENLKAAMPGVVAHVKGGWDNVQAFHIKTGSSAALPLWTCALGTEEGSRWDGLVASPEDAEKSDDEDEDEEPEEKEEEKEEEKPLESKKRKRAGKEEAEEGEGKKKAKAKAPAEPELILETKGKKKRVAKEEVDTPKKKAKVDAEQSRDTKVDAEPSKKAKVDAEPVKKAKIDIEPAKKAKVDAEPSKKAKGNADVPKKAKADAGAPKKAKKDVTLTSAPAAPALEEAPALKEKGKGKKRAAAEAEESKPAHKAKPTSSTGEKPRSKAPKSSVAVDSSDASPAAAPPPLKSILKKGKATTAEPSPAPAKKAKAAEKEKKVAPADETQSVKTSEVKKKRAGEGLEKKKVKMAEAKLGTKPAKAAVLGKRKA